MVTINKITVFKCVFNIKGSILSFLKLDPIQTWFVLSHFFYFYEEPERNRMMTTCRFTVTLQQSWLANWFFMVTGPTLLSQQSVETSAGLTVSLGGFTSQQLARSLWLEVAAGDALTVTAVQHFLVPVLLHLLKTHRSKAVWQCFCVCVRAKDNVWNIHTPWMSLQHQQQNLYQLKVSEPQLWERKKTG